MTQKEPLLSNLCKGGFYLFSLYKLKGGWEGRYLQENIIHDSNLQVVRMVSWEE